MIPKPLPARHAWMAAICLVVGCHRVDVVHQPKEAPASLATRGKEEADDGARVSVRLGKIPEVALSPRPPLDAKQVARIKECIASLAAIDRPDFGLSPTISGNAFLPLAGQRSVHTFVFADHGLQTANSLQTLVERGPDSLPFLLAALDDKTPTKLTIQHESFLGAMWFANELWGNPVNPVEARVLGPRRARTPADKERHINTYTVKVGDLCLVAIGQIVGRGYQAVRYQPTACVVINSPTEDATLREQVRAIWSSPDPAKRLFDGFLIDYATVADDKKGDAMDGRGQSSSLQTEAALRLLYYFPKETAPLIARRLRSLHVEGTGRGSRIEPTKQELDAWKHRELTNGVEALGFVKAVSWCAIPEIRDALRSIFERTGDARILLAALPALDDSARELIKCRIASLIKGVPRQDEAGPYGDGYYLLIAAGQGVGAASKPLFETYLKGAGPLRRFTVCQAILESKANWCVDLLTSLLDDKRPVGGYNHAAAGGDQEWRVPIRVCDAAAQSLSSVRRELKFTMVGTEKDLDRQIQVIRQQLSRAQSGR